MTNRNILLRQKIFDLFSKNLEIIKSDPLIEVEPDFHTGYICPICLETFTKCDLLDTSKNQLTIEDVPPKSLGGNPKLLTCKKCNSICGHTIDRHLARRIKELDAHELLPNSEFKTTFLSKNSMMNGKFEIDQEGKFILKFKEEWSNPNKSEQFINDVFPPKTIYNPLFYSNKEIKPYKTNKFSIQLPNSSNQRKAEIALLKTGYLLAFSFFGNAFLINSELSKVREQILNSDKPILQNEFWINYDFPEDLTGINLIKSPRALRCYLVIFNLKTQSKKRQYAIALPGPTSPGINIYKNMEQFFSKVSDNEIINFEIEHINDLEYVKQQDGLGAIFYWRKYCKDNFNSG